MFLVYWVGEKKISDYLLYKNIKKTLKNVKDQKLNKMSFKVSNSSLNCDCQQSYENE